MFVEYKFLLYICRVNSKNVEDATFKNRRTIDATPLEAR